MQKQTPDGRMQLYIGTKRITGERGDGMTQEELREIPIFAGQINKRLERLNYLKEKSTCVPSLQTTERVQTTVIDRSNVLSDTIVDLESEIEEEVRRLKAMQNQAEKCFSAHDLSLDERELLEYRYIYCYTWEEVASLLHIGERTARLRHYRIMKKIF